MSSTRLEHKMSTCLVLDICIKISHVEHSKVDIFSGRSRMVNTEKLTLKNFPIIIKICIDPAFDEENYAYDNPREFIANVKNMKDSDGEIFFDF